MIESDRQWKLDQKWTKKKKKKKKKKIIFRKVKVKIEALIDLVMMFIIVCLVSF